MTDAHVNTPIPPITPAATRRAAAEALEAERAAGLERVAKLREELLSDPVLAERPRLGLPPTETEIAHERLLVQREAEAKQLDETVPGGRYLDERGRVVDAFGRVLDAFGRVLDEAR